MTRIFGYEKGECSWTQLSLVMPDKNGKKWRYADVKWTFKTH